MCLAIKEVIDMLVKGICICLF